MRVPRRSRTAAAAALAVSLAVAGCGPGGSASVPPPTASTPPSAAAPTPFVSTATLPPGRRIDAAGAQAIASGAGDWMVLGGGLAWTLDTEAHLLSRWDLATGERHDALATTDHVCLGMDVGFGAVWGADCGVPASIVRYDLASGERSTVGLDGPIAEQEATVAAGEGGVWVVTGDAQRTLVRIDPATMTVAGRTPLPGLPTAVRAGLGAVWAVDPTHDAVLRIDPASGAVVATIPVDSRPTFLTIGAGSVWVMAHASGTVVRIDPATNAVTAIVRLGGPVRTGEGDIAFGGGSVWVHGYDPLAWRIDPATDQVTAVYTFDAGSGSIAADDDAAWITTEGPRTLFRLPLR
jgi:virginiamycin B lyase